MPETEPISQKPLWKTIPSPLTRVVLAAFTEGVGEEPDQMPRDEYLRIVAGVYPMTDGQPEASLSAGTWGARNVLVGRMHEVEPRKVAGMTGTLARLAGDNETSHFMADSIKEVIGTRERGEAGTIIKRLSQQAIARSIQQAV